ncbi:MAG: class I SAM-dependent methyltransferase [Pseudomonadota bacterium]
MAEVNPAAREAFSQASAAYVTGRPGYPGEIDGWLKERVGIGPGSVVADLGAGTGKFTARLLGSGARVIALEPVDGMRDKLRETCPMAQALGANAAEIPLADESLDGIFCAQSFHWFATGDTLAEFRRVLKPGCALGLIWNMRDVTVDWVAALDRIMDPFERATPRFHEGQWRLCFPAEGFAPLIEEIFTHHHEGSFETVVVKRILSVSFIAALPDDRREEVARQVRQLAGTSPDLADPDHVRFPYKTLVAWTKKLPA